MSSWLPLLTAFGMGSLVSTLVQWFINSRTASRQRQYDERKEAYVGLLEAWVAQEKSDFASHSDLDVGHLALRAQLVASNEVNDLLIRWMETEPGSPVRIDATKQLKHAMRRDLRSY